MKKVKNNLTEQQQKEISVKDDIKKYVIRNRRVQEK